MKIRLGTLRRIVKEAALPPVRKIPAGVHGPEYLRRRAAARNGSNVPRGFDFHPSYARPDATAGLGSLSASEAYDGDDEPDYEGHLTKAARQVHSLGQDPDGDTFAAIAHELGMSVAGAKNVVDTALSKARFLATLPEGELDLLVVAAVADYVGQLAGSGELSDAEVKELRDNPEAVAGLDGFREFLGRRLKAARRGAITRS